VCSSVRKVFFLNEILKRSGRTGAKLCVNLEKKIQTQEAFHRIDTILHNLVMNSEESSTLQAEPACKEARIGGGTHGAGQAAAGRHPARRRRSNREDPAAVEPSFAG
jgi:hypothetical protein